MRLRLIALVLPLCAVTLVGCSSRTSDATSGSSSSISGGSTWTDRAVSDNSGFPRKAGQYTVLGILTDNQDNNKAKENAETTLIRHPEVGCLVGLWSQNTPMILAALRSSDAVVKVNVVRFDGDP